MDTFHRQRRHRQFQQRRQQRKSIYALCLAICLLYGLLCSFGSTELISVTTSSFDGVIDSTSNSSQALSSSYDANVYRAALKETLQVLPDIATACNIFPFYSGLTNQIMRFIGIVSLAGAEDYLQFMEPSIQWKDTFGTNDMVSHYKLWDVVHWNSQHYPAVPRFVAYDPKYHPHVVLHKNTIVTMEETIILPSVEYNKSSTLDIWANRSITKPSPIGGHLHTSRNTYMQLMRIVDQSGGKTIGDPMRKAQFEVYREMLKGALRPHPFLQEIVEKERIRLGNKYMTLHARVEPDMARQDRVCVAQKVWNITRLLDAIYKEFPDPPASINTVLIQFSRHLMEAEASRMDNQEDKYHVMNEYNLNEINRIVEEGMWNGKIRVVEAGSKSVQDAGNSYYKRYSTMAGGIVNLFLAIQSDIFVGTEVSTYSVHAANSRFYRGIPQEANYFYVPEGLKPAIQNDKQHRFGC